MNNLTGLPGFIYKIYKYRKRIKRFLEICEKDNMASAGSINVNEVQLLKELVLAANKLNGPILEIGTLFGFTTQYITSFKSSEKHLITIDNFSWNPLGLSSKAHFQFTKRSLSYLIEKCNVKLVNTNKIAFYENYSYETPSMIFIDADHSYDAVMYDIKWAKKIGIPIISGHDYCDSYPGVKRAVDEQFHRNARVDGSCWAYMDNSVMKRDTNII